MKIKSFKAFQDAMFKKNSMCYVEAQYGLGTKQKRRCILSAICVNNYGDVIAVYVFGKGIVWEADKD